MVDEEKAELNSPMRATHTPSAFACSQHGWRSAFEFDMVISFGTGTNGLD